MEPTKVPLKSLIKLKSTQIFIVAGTVLMTMAISLICIGLTVRYEVNTDTVDAGSIPYWSFNLPPEQEIWFQRGIQDLRLTSKGRSLVEGKVENVLIFLADGVTTDMLAQARFGENGTLMDFLWDSFPHLGILKSSCGSARKCDPLSMATALFDGVQTKAGLGGLDSRVEWQNCSQSLGKEYRVHSILEHAQEAKMRTGFVTTKRVTSPPISALYAHTSNTQWVCDTFMTLEKYQDSDCLDIAKQLMIGDTGQHLNVIMGGGRQSLISLPIANQSEVVGCISQDRRNLLQDWKLSKLERNSKFKLLDSIEELNDFNGASVDFLTGIFANGVDDDTCFRKMVAKSLEVLRRPIGDYILVAETATQGSKIGEFEQTLMELNATIADVMKDSRFSPESTLMVVAFMDFTQFYQDKISPRDILLFAKGPNSHLFHSVHEITYMAHVISYSLKIGPFQRINSPENKNTHND
ncbi:alkaline phosphatase 13 [Haematobia irritans]|uniref:alkaline phosphatase 13 n=1 Tax=Haematobia irritans TaxID=7368 RepID=UPI003F505C5F